MFGRKKKKKRDVSDTTETVDLEKVDYLKTRLVATMEDILDHDTTFTMTELLIALDIVLERVKREQGGFPRDEES